MSDIIIKNIDGLELLQQQVDNSIDLILTDPPYITSRDSGMNKWNLKLKKFKGNQKTEEEWEIFKKTLSEKIQEKLTDTDKKNYIKYGDRFGKRFGYATDYGDWDKEFTVEQLDCFIQEFYRVLKPGGTCIIFFDLWKVTVLKELYEKHRFKQVRFVEWIKTNPVPINSKLNYLTNSREVAITAVKKSKPTFHSKYDKGIYEYPIYGGKDRFHPTQKSLKLFEDLVKKHSNENDLVLDCFLGSATTALACKNTNRRFVGAETDENYYKKSVERLK